ncbi:MAG: sigma-E factor regulatory protein RseB domain-containing protein [Planctomycetota bacterium]
MPAFARLRVVRWVAKLGALLVLAQVVDCELEHTSAATAVNRLSRMLEAERSLPYQGMKEVEFGGRTQFLLVSHHADGSTAVETAGVPTRRRNKSWVHRRHRFYWLSDFDLLLRNYRVRELSKETVLGRGAITLEVRSVHPGRPRMRLVVDEETGLLLDAEKFDHRGVRTYRSRFTTLLLDPELPDPPPSRKMPWFPWKPHGRTGSGGLPFTPLEARYLPDGFEKTSSFRHGFPRGSMGPRLVTTYSDGLTWIQLSQSLAKEGSEENVVRQRVHGSRVSMVVVVNGIRVRLVGSLAPSALVEVLESLGIRPDG